MSSKEWTLGHEVPSGKVVVPPGAPAGDGVRPDWGLVPQRSMVGREHGLSAAAYGLVAAVVNGEQVPPGSAATAPARRRPGARVVKP